MEVFNQDLHVVHVLVHSHSMQKGLLATCILQINTVDTMVFLLYRSIHRRRKRGGRGGGDSPPPPNFTYCLHNELHCSIVIL